MDVLETFADPRTYISEISFVVTINCVLSIAFPKNFTLLDVLKRSVLFFDLSKYLRDYIGFAYNFDFRMITFFFAQIFGDSVWKYIT
mgnify:CR=1 FL=1